jgi:hypothetical protein
MKKIATATIKNRGLMIKRLRHNRETFGEGTDQRTTLLDDSTTRYTFDKVSLTSILDYKKFLICVTIFALVLLFNTSCFAENITYVYDDLNRLWQEQHEDGTKIIYTYDEVGNRTWKTVGDTTPPTGSITINGGATYTNSSSVTLALSATDPSGVSQMCISNTTTCSTWETYAASKSWTLTTGDGGKTVYAWFKDTAGNADATPYSNAITLDATAPTNGTLSATAGNTQVSLSWSGFTDATSGIGSYKLVYATGAAPSTCSSGTQIYSGTGTSYTHTGLTNGTTYYYRACAIDNAQNTSSGSTASATPVGGTPPTVTSSSASSITATGAILNGTVNPNGTSTTAYFQYGTTTNYGTTTLLQNMGSGTSGEALTQAISGLTCNTTYHYRAVGTNTGGTTNGSDMTFTTSACSSALVIRVEGSLTVGTYSTVQTAYNNSISGDTIEMQATNFNESPNFNLNISVLLKGGYDSAFGSQTGYTTITGTLTISNGTAVVDNLVIQ